MASQASTFITATTKDSLRPDPRTRKIIRRHVMKGRNRKGKAMTVAAGHHEKEARSQIATPNLRIGLTLDSKTIDLMSACEYPHDRCCRNVLMIVSVDNDAAVIAVMQRSMHPVYCLVDIPSSSEQMFAHLQSDLRFARTFCDIARAYHSITSHGSPLQMNLHTLEALRALQSQLRAANEAFEDRLLLTVLMLGMFAESRDDFAAARTHMSGLAAIIRIRGGLSALPSMLRVKACRLDLRLAIRTLSEPFLAMDTVLSNSNQITDKFSIGNGLATSSLAALCDRNCTTEHVRNIYVIFHACTLQFNLAFRTGRKVTPEFFQHALSSILYRLLHLRRQSSAEMKTGNRVLVFAMLTLAARLFLRLDNEDHSHSKLIALRLKEGLSALMEDSKGASDPQRLRLLLWLVFIERLAVSRDPADSQTAGLWIRRLSVRLSLTSWKSIREVVKDFLWVDALFDAPGKVIWESSCSQPYSARLVHLPR